MSSSLHPINIAVSHPQSYSTPSHLGPNFLQVLCQNSLLYPPLPQLQIHLLQTFILLNQYCLWSIVLRVITNLPPNPQLHQKRSRAEGEKTMHSGVVRASPGRSHKWVLPWDWVLPRPGLQHSINRGWAHLILRPLCLHPENQGTQTFFATPHTHILPTILFFGCYETDFSISLSLFMSVTRSPRLPSLSQTIIPTRLRTSPNLPLSSSPPQPLRLFHCAL